MSKFKFGAILCLIGVFAAQPVAAETTTIRIQVGSDEVEALIALPKGPGPHAAIIYNHGMIVRVKGNDLASSRGYDTAGYVTALADAGYIGLAPIRDHLAAADFSKAINGGVQTVAAAIDYLKNRSDVDASRIGIIGFSEGGLVTLWSAIGNSDLKAVVLMSPATMNAAGDKRLEAALQKPLLQRLDMPVMLTVGSDDIGSIRTVTAEQLIPMMKNLGKPLTYRTDYPGDHKWFWKVRPNHFPDVKKFLSQHLKPAG